jgi:hypothetical protein
MGNLDTLKLTDATRPKIQPPVIERRNKLSKKLWEQMELAKARNAGTNFTVKRFRTIKDLEGNVRSVERDKRIKPWWFTSNSGTLCVQVFYGSKALELASGKTAIEARDLAHVVEILGLIKHEVELGTLDHAIETASHLLRSRFEMDIPKTRQTNQKSVVLGNSTPELPSHK